MDAMTRIRLLAVEVLLAEPEALDNDALEGDLYILRDRLAGPGTGTARVDGRRELPAEPGQRALHPFPGADRGEGSGP